MIYAPIAITTLNRYEHLKKCIESLQKNPWSEFTDLYISVDYPPSKKYEDGYEKICDYLNGNIEGFKNIFIYYQKSNLGACKNALFLNNEVLSKNDRIIILEDDNEVSPCFIEFCDRGLEIFENDDSVVAINASSYVWCGKGYKDFDTESKEDENNVVKRPLLFHSFATWKKEWVNILTICEDYSIYHNARKLEFMTKLYKKSKCFFYHYLDYVVTSKKSLPWYDGGNKLYPIDSVWDVYMLVNDKYVICPKLSLFRDLGVDGSGVNYTEKFENAEVLLNKKINQNLSFEYRMPKDIEIDEKEIYLHDKYQYRSLRVRLIKLAKYILVLLKIKK